MEYRFWPEDTWIDRIGPRMFFVNQDDQSGLRVYSEFSPQLQMAWAGDSFFSAGVNEIRERLKPSDFPGLATTRDYEQERWFVNFSTDMFSKVGFGVNYDDGTVINLVPPLASNPSSLTASCCPRSCAGGRSTVSASMRRISRRRSTIRTASARSSTTRSFARA